MTKAKTKIKTMQKYFFKKNTKNDKTHNKITKTLFKLQMKMENIKIETFLI